MAREKPKNREGTQAVEPRRQGQVSRTQPWPSSGPFSMMRRFSDEMDRMFDLVFEGYGLPALERFNPWTASESISPHVDMFERDGKLVISADLPGMTKDDVKVDITENAILLEGERKYEHEQREEGVYRSERGYGQFRRQIPLPEGVKSETAKANFKNGVLEVTMEAPQIAKNRRRIQVQGEESTQKPGEKVA